MLQAPMTIELIGDLLRSAGALLLVAVAGALLVQRHWERAPFLAPVYGLLSCGVVGMLAFASWLISPWAGRAWAFAAAAAAVVVIVRARRRARLDPTARRLGGETVIVLLTMVAATAVSVGLLLLWTDVSPLYPLARQRFAGALPIDNELPSAVANALFRGDDPRGSVAGWQSSDRPQLQAGLLLFVDGLVHYRVEPSATLHFATSMLAQLGWVTGAYALARALGVGVRASSVGLLFAAASGSVLVNSVFTWPKLLSAGLLLGGIAVIIEAARRRERSAAPLVALGASIALAFLSHGAALFAMPIVGAVLLAYRRRMPLRALVLGGGTAVFLYVPWLAYQRFYDPPGDRLLKWHLAGVKEPTDESLLHLIASSYGSRSGSELLAQKWSNLTMPWNRLPWIGLNWDGVEIHLRQRAQFTTLSVALSMALIAVILLAGREVLRRYRGPVAVLLTDPVERRIGLLLVACGGAIFLWSVVMFGPTATSIHVGTHLFVLLPMVLPVAWLAGRFRRAGLVLLGLQVALLLKSFGPHLGHADIQWTSALIVLGGLALGGLVLTAATRLEYRDALASRPAAVEVTPLALQPATVRIVAPRRAADDESLALR